MDAAPLLTDLGLPFKVGIDDLVSLVPIYGDVIAGLLQLYQVLLSILFGIDYTVALTMLVTVVVDIVVGIVPLLGDYLDYLFKANLRNLETLEVRSRPVSRILADVTSLPELASQLAQCRKIPHSPNASLVILPQGGIHPITSLEVAIWKSFLGQQGICRTSRQHQTRGRGQDEAYAAGRRLPC